MNDDLLASEELELAAMEFLDACRAYACDDEGSAARSRYIEAARRLRELARQGEPAPRGRA